MTDERRRILDLLAEDRISVDQAETLLRALGGSSPKPTGKSLPAVPQPPEPPTPQGARSLQILINNEDTGKQVNVTVPIGLIRFASRFVPAGARREMADSGIQLDEIVNSLESPELLQAGSTLVQIDADEGEGHSTITIKAV